MYQGEEGRLRSGSLARERKHLALCINNQVGGIQKKLALKYYVITMKWIICEDIVSI